MTATADQKNNNNDNNDNNDVDNNNVSTLGCAVIVGVGPGLGRSLALTFAKGGYNVALISRTKTKTQAVEKEIKDQYSNNIATLCLEADTSNIDQCKAAYKQIIDPSNKLGRIEVLCFNAAYRGFTWPPPSFLDVNITDYQKSFEIGAKGAFIWSQLVIPDMLTNKNKTSILMTGATAAMRGGSKFSAFASSKFALRALSQSIAREFHPKGIHACHFIIDARILGDITKIDANNNGTFANPNDIASTYYFIHQQNNSCWTQELDIRPNMEKF